MLSKEQLAQIKKLQTECETGEDFQLKLNWDMLRRRSTDGEHDFFHYDNNELVGFLGLYGFGTKIEVCGMVKPAYRRQGIFSKLFDQAMAIIHAGNYKEILLNTPTKSLSGRGFVDKQTSDYLMSEHQMQHNGMKQTDIPNENKNVVLRHAVQQDFDTEVSLDVRCFDLSMIDAIESNDRRKRDEMQRFYMIDYLGETVGKIRVAHTDGEAWIYGFAIFPEYQGKGIGRQTLVKVIQQELEYGYPIFLEVEARNSHALRLYESCGFKAYQSQDYYMMVK